ncbi:ATP-binding cassette domain-containing protein [Aliihoeflea sp. PC F10.4]
MLKFDGEALAYGTTTVLSDVDFALHPGERVVLLGRSGAGKSTLLNAAYKRLAASLPEIALVPQEHGLVPQLSVFHNVYMGRLDAHGAIYNLANLAWPFPSQRRSVAAALETVGLTGFDRKPVESLSGGQKQRTALARAIHRGGSILVGDEPVSAVDERQAVRLIDELGRRFETILLALHDVDLARRVATRLVGIRGGRIHFDRPTADISDGDIHDLYRA